MRRLATRTGGLEVLPAAVATEILCRITDLVFSLPHIVEWDCIDDILLSAVTYFLSYTEEHGKFSDDCLLKWNKIFSCILT